MVDEIRQLILHISIQCFDEGNLEQPLHGITHQLVSTHTSVVMLPFHHSMD